MLQTEEHQALTATPNAFQQECYVDMRRIARCLVSHDGMARVLQPTQPANEAAIRLLRSKLDGVTDKGHMLALAARTMRRVLIGEARKTTAYKRQPLVVTILPDDPANQIVDLEALDRALLALAEHSADHAKVVELRFMLGLSLAEIVVATGLSQRTVTRRWQASRLWLLDHIGDENADAVCLSHDPHLPEPQGAVRRSNAMQCQRRDGYADASAG